MNWLLCPNNWSVLVACRVAPVVVERVVVRSICPSTASSGNGLASWTPLRPLAGTSSSLKQSRPGSARASLGLGRIAVHRLLPERADARRAFDRPGRRGLDLSGQIGIGNLVGRGLRRGVGRAPVVLQQFDRHRRRRAEIVLGDAHVEVKFAAVGPVADIAVEAADRRFRKIAIAVVTHAFERAIDRKIVDLLAILRRALDAPERAAHRVDFGALDS